MFGHRRFNKIVGAAIGFVLAATAAFAAWTILNKSGEGVVKVGSLQDVSFQSINVTEATDTLALPGATAGLTFRVNNQNSIAVKLTDLRPNGTPLVTNSTGASVSGCTGLNFTVNTLTGLSINVAAGVSLITVPDAITMSASAPTECQGAFVKAPVLADFSA